MSAVQPSHRVCIAPMMDRTDRHFRYFMRLISGHVRLYTEMITTGALIHGDPDRHLKFHSAEHPLAVQLGGSDPQELANCARICTDFGYDEINLNVGCPSDRVQSGEFGVCLMNHPGRVADCVQAMVSQTNLPVTVKCRTGVDDRDSYEDLANFIDVVRQSGCRVFIIHARKAWLQGLSPKENREIPPLNYSTVHTIKRDFPGLTIVINGGFTEPGQISEQLEFVDGVMLGRAAYANPWMLTATERLFNQDNPVQKQRLDILRELIPYARSELQNGTRIYHITRHILGLFQQQRGARKFRRWISENAHEQNAGIEILEGAVKIMEEFTD
ncbi:MAG: tRNA dihydrouridine(20/20a) synthase DusA [Thiotrichales bacterium]|nr:tRNA dihydrouridine(20/20a) synthase DusA [Thiotrichales bacterium]